MILSTIIASGSQYGAQDVIAFCIDTVVPPQGGMPGITSLLDETFKVYPNPASDLLHVNWYSETAGPASIQLTDLTGRKVAAYTTSSVQGKNTFDLPLQKLSSGMYLLKLESSDNTFQQKVMIQQP